MKEIYYSGKEGGELFLLTDNELEKAEQAWSRNNNFKCKRLGCTLSPRYNWIKNPRLSEGMDVFIEHYQEGNSSGYRRVYRDGAGRYYQYLQSLDGGPSLRRKYVGHGWLVEGEGEELTDEQRKYIANLVPEDEFYEADPYNKNLLD